MELEHYLYTRDIWCRSGYDLNSCKLDIDNTMKPIYSSMDWSGMWGVNNILFKQFLEI